MSGKRKLWVGVAVAYLAFLMWHQPLRGPLSESEIRSAFGEHYEQMRSRENSQASKLIQFFLSDNGRPFYMINMNALPEQTPETREAALNYGSYMLPRLLARASYPVISTNVAGHLVNSLGPGLEKPGQLIVVRYRSRRDFMEIISSQEFRVAVKDKVASLDGWYTAPSSASPLISIPQIVLILLLGIGLIGSSFNMRSPG